jgi:hypothetical protein
LNKVIETIQAPYLRVGPSSLQNCGDASAGGNLTTGVRMKLVRHPMISLLAPIPQTPTLLKRQQTEKGRETTLPTTELSQKSAMF